MAPLKVGTLALRENHLRKDDELLSLCSHSVLQQFDATLFCFDTDEIRAMTALDAAKSTCSERRLSAGTRTIFLINGLGMPAWAPLVPYARDRLQLEGASLGALLLCLGIGSLLAMPVTGTLVARFGCRRVMMSSTLLVLLMLPVLATAPSHLVMAAALMLFGAGLGMLDVAMNYQAVEVEKAAGRPMMSGFHAFFSLGGILGAGAVSLLLGLTLTPLLSVLIVMAVMVALLLWRLSGYMNQRLHQPDQPWLVIPRGRVAFLGDNLINAADITTSQVLTGRTTGAEEGQTISLFVGDGAPIATAVIGADGAWSIDLTPDVLASLNDGPLVFGLRVSDVAGNQTDATITVNKVVNAALNLVVDSVFGDGTLSAIDTTIAQTITGTATSAGVGATVAVTIGGTTLTSAVGQDGKWAIVVPPNVLGLISDGQLALDVTLTDAAGNVRTVGKP